MRAVYMRIYTPWNSFDVWLHHGYTCRYVFFSMHNFMKMCRQHLRRYFKINERSSGLTWQCAMTYIWCTGYAQYHTIIVYCCEIINYNKELLK